MHKPSIIIEHNFDELHSAVKQARDVTSTLEQLQKILLQGIHLRVRLQDWKQRTFGSSPTLVENTSDLLGVTYYSATSIFLSGAFDYFPVWQGCGISTPALTTEEVDFHLATVLSTTEQLLKYRRVAGVSLLFPLRVAGARSRFDHSSARRVRVLQLLRQIRSLYAVSEAVIGDLQDLWDAT